MQRTLIVAALSCLTAFFVFYSYADDKMAEPAKPLPDHYQTAIFAGGCFWCVESDFEKVPGVKEVISGYTGGRTDNPTYKQVSYENTGHFEAAKIIYDPGEISYDKLLHLFWRSIDPIDPGGQFCDRGSSYRTAIFAVTDAQKDAALRSKKEIDASGKLGKPIVTPILMAGKFYPAEDYHQDYYKKNPKRYKYYRTSCRRDARLRTLWGDEAIGH